MALSDKHRHIIAAIQSAKDEILSISRQSTTTLS
jgi:hypothetical protein